GLDELRPAVGVAGVVHGVNTNIKIAGVAGFGEAGRERQKNEVAGRDIGDGDPGGDCVFVASLGDVDFGGERRTAKGAQVEGQNEVFACAEGGGDAAGGVEFVAVALAVVDGEAVADQATVAGDGQGHSAVEPAGEQDDGARGGVGRIRGHGAESVRRVRGPEEIGRKLMLSEHPPRDRAPGWGTTGLTGYQPQQGRSQRDRNAQKMWGGGNPPPQVGAPIPPARPRDAWCYSLS